MSVATKRAYEPAAPEDGTRYLVDRLWPRGVTKERLHVAAWLKEIAPSETLRRRFHHDPAEFAQFRAAYRRELLARPEAWAGLAAEVRDGPVTLVYAARDGTHSNAAVLAELLREGDVTVAGLGVGKSARARGSTTPRPAPRGRARAPARAATRGSGPRTAPRG